MKVFPEKLLTLIIEHQGGKMKLSSIMKIFTLSLVFFIISNLTIYSQEQAKINITTVKAPIGTIIMYAGEITPKSEILLRKKGWLLCDGREELIKPNGVDFHPLFALFGHKFKTGTVPTGKFLLPDLTARIPMGAYNGLDNEHSARRLEDSPNNLDVGDRGGAWIEKIDSNRFNHKHTINHTHEFEHTHKFSGTTGGMGGLAGTSVWRGSPASNGDDHLHSFGGETKGMNGGSGAMTEEEQKLKSFKTIAINKAQPYLVVNFLIKFK